MSMMTQQQQAVLDLARKLNTAEFGDWFELSEVMAFCQVESAFRPRASRFEPRLNESSYGLMQVLASTAKSVGLVGTPDQMYQPEIALRVGMKVARLYWDQEERHFGREPTYEEWAASYNEGVGGAERDVAAVRDPDPAYTAVWDAAQEHWAQVLGEG